MPAPITLEQYDHALALLQTDPLHERLLNKEIAVRAGVSESTVRNIRHGRMKRPGVSQPEPEAAAVAPKRVKKHNGVDIAEVAEYRCPTCRNVVITKPCLYCTLKGRA